MGLDANEFVTQFSRMRTLVLRTEIFYLVKYAEKMQATLARQEAAIQSIQEHFEINKIEKQSSNKSSNGKAAVKSLNSLGSEGMHTSSKQEGTDTPIVQG